MADENRKASRIAAIKNYKAPGTSLIKINQQNVPNSILTLPDVDDPSTFDRWGELFNTLTFPQLAESLRELKSFLDEWKVLGDATIDKSNQNEYLGLNNNLKTFGVKVGYSNLTTTDATKVFIHGFDKEGRPADSNGSFFLMDDVTETSGVDNPVSSVACVGSIVAPRNIITKTTLGPVNTSFNNQLTLLIIEKETFNYVPKLICIPRDQVNESTATYYFSSWNKNTDSLSTSSSINTDLKFPATPTNYGKFYNAADGTVYNPYRSEIDATVTREVATWNDTSRGLNTPANVANYVIKNKLVKDAFVIGVFETSLVSGSVNFTNYSSFPTPVSMLSFLLSFEIDKNFVNFRLQDFKDKEALFKKIHDEIQNRVLDANKIKCEIDRNLRPFTLKKQNEGSIDYLVLEYFNNTANSVIPSLFKNDVTDSAVVYPVTLSTRKRFLSATLLNNDLDEVWFHGKGSEKLLRLGVLNSVNNNASELMSGFKVNGNLLITGSSILTGGVSLSSTLSVTAAVTLLSTLDVTGLATFANDIMINGGDLGTTATTFNFIDSVATTVNAFGATTALNLGHDGVLSSNTNLAKGATASGNTKTISIGTDSATGSTTNLFLGSLLGTSTLNLQGNVITTGTLLQTGDSSFSGVVTITGATLINNTLGVLGLVTLANDLIINGGDLTTTASTFNLLNTGLNILNIGATAGTLTLGGITGNSTTNLQTGATTTGFTKTVNLGTGGLAGSVTSLVFGSTVGTSTLLMQGNSSFTGSVSVTGVASLNSTLSVTGLVTLTGDLAVNGGDLTTTATLFNLLATTATTVNFANQASTLLIGSSVTGTQLITLGDGATVSGSTKSIYLGSNGVSGSTTNIYLGTNSGVSEINLRGTVTHVGNQTTSGTLSVNGAVVFSSTLGVTGNTTLTGDLAVNGGDLTTSVSTFNLIDTIVTTVNAFGTAIALNLGYDNIGSSITNINNGTTSSGNTKIINLGTNGLAGSTTNIYLGTVAGTSNIYIQGNYNVSGISTLTGQLNANGGISSTAINTIGDIVSVTEIKAGKLKENAFDTGVQKYLSDIYQPKYVGSAGINAINLPKDSLMYITKGATAYGSLGYVEPVDYLKGTWDSGNKIFSNTNYKFGINFANDFIVLANDSFIKYPVTSSGFKTNFTVYTSFSDFGFTQLAANTYFEFLKWTNGADTLEFGFQTNSSNDNFTLVTKRNGVILIGTITSWEGTGGIKNAGEVFRDNLIKDRSISFNFYSGFLSVLVGAELVEKYVCADFANNLTTLTVGKNSTNALKCAINSIVIAPFNTSEFSYYNGTDWVPNKDYNQELQSNKGKFFYNRQPDFVEIISGKVYVAGFSSSNVYTGDNTYDGSSTFRGDFTSQQAIKVTANNGVGMFSNATSIGIGTFISNNGTHSIYTGNSTATAPKYSSDSGATVYDIITTRHGFETPNGSIVNLVDASSLDSLAKTGFYDVYNYSGAPVANIWFYVNEYQHSRDQNSWKRQEIRSFDGFLDYFRVKTSGVWGSLIKNWNANNDGTGSGLDADLLEGYHGSGAAAINTYPLRGSTVANIQVAGSSASWGVTSGTNTGGINVVCGTSTSATWLISGTNGGVFKGGIQLLDVGDAMRIYTSASRYLDFLTTEMTWAGNMLIGGDLTINGGDISSSATTFNLLNQSTTVNAFTNATTLILGSSTDNSAIGLGNGVSVSGKTKTIFIGNAGLNGSTTNITLGSESGGATNIKLVGSTINNGTMTINGVLTANSGINTTNISASGTLSVIGATTFTGSTTLNSTLGVTGLVTFAGDLAVNGGNLTTTNSTFNLLNTNVTTINAFSTATTIRIASSQTTALNIGIADSPIASGLTKNVWLGSSGVSGSITNIYLGSATTGAISTITSNGNHNITSGLSLTQLSGSGTGISLYGGQLYTNGLPSHGLAFAQTSTFGTHGATSGGWATYFTLNDSGANNYGWIFRNVNTQTNLLSISSVDGDLVSNGAITAGTEGFKTGNATVKYNTTTKSIDFVVA